MRGEVLPVLREDGSSMDWEQAKYQTEVQIRRGGATVEHRLESAPELEELLGRGLVRFALEVRCPRSLFSRTFSGDCPTLEASWDPENAQGPVYLMPGLVAVADVALSTAGLIEIWGEERLAVPQGAWLARGRMSRSENLAASLVVFRRSDELQDGPRSRMSVREDNSEGEPRFVVYLPSDLYRRAHHDRSIQVAGLIAACGLLPRSAFFREDAESRVAQELRVRLREAGVATWDTDEDETWDPALAATVLEPFVVEPQAADEE